MNGRMNHEQIHAQLAALNNGNIEGLQGTLPYILNCEDVASKVLRLKRAIIQLKETLQVEKQYNNPLLDTQEKYDNFLAFAQLLSNTADQLPAKELPLLSQLAYLTQLKIQYAGEKNALNELNDNHYCKVLNKIEERAATTSKTYNLFGHSIAVPAGLRQILSAIAQAFGIFATFIGATAILSGISQGMPFTALAGAFITGIGVTLYKQARQCGQEASSQIKAAKQYKSINVSAKGLFSDHSDILNKPVSAVGEYKITQISRASIITAPRLTGGAYG